MSPESITERVVRLEEQMHALQELPKKIDDLSLQFSQFQAEVRSEFSAVNRAMRAGDEETRRQMRVLHEEVIARIALLQESERPISRRTRRKKR